MVSALSLFSCSIVLCLMSSVAVAAKSTDGPAKNGNATSDSHAHQRHDCSFQCRGIKAIQETSKRPAHASSQFRLRVVPLAAWALRALRAPSLLIQQPQNCSLPLGQQSCADLSSGCLSRYPENSSSGFYSIFFKSFSQRQRHEFTGAEY